MTKIAISPNPNGNGTFTIAAPNSNTDRTLTLPDAGGIVNTSGQANEVPVGSAAAPSVFPTGDTNTGLLFPASDVAAFATGGSERMRISASGNVGIGTSDPSDPLTVIGRGSFTRQLDGNFGTAALQVVSNVGNVGITLHCAGASAPILRNERGAGDVVDIVNSTVSGFSPIRASAFNVTSDYRIKENVQPLGGAAERVALLKPCRFNFIEGSMMYQDGAAVDGFIAHEVQEVVPEAVSGVKDELMDTGAPKHQSLDQSKLVPLLTAALQEALADIATLKAEVAALKGASA